MNLRQEEADNKGVVDSTCFISLQLSHGVFNPCAPSVGPGLSLGSMGNYLCDPYLLQITVSSTEKGMLKFHESVLHTFSMLYSRIFFKCMYE